MRLIDPSKGLSFDCVHCRTSIGYLGAWDKFLIGLVIWTLVHTGEALAADETVCPVNAGKSATPLRAETRMPRLPPEHFLFQPNFAAPEFPLETSPVRDFSARDIRRRASSIPNDDERFAAHDVAPTLTGSTVWQRLAEYRSHDRVRVVTLWETGSSSVSLQAGRRGDPSLQWTSRAMNWGGATRGVLDQLLINSLVHVGKTLHVVPHASSTEPTGVPMKSGEP